eukprot:scaffold71382_cov58-Phaeocystis_antarctica.AAC.1
MRIGLRVLGDAGEASCEGGHGNVLLDAARRAAQRGTDEDRTIANVGFVCRCAIERRCPEHTRIIQVSAVGGVVRSAVAVDQYAGTPLTHPRDADPVAIRGRQLPAGGQIVVGILAGDDGRVVGPAIDSRIPVAA